MSVDPSQLTLAEFLAWEARQPAKHEFRAGAIFAMAGATDDRPNRYESQRDSSAPFSRDEMSGICQ